MIQCLPTPTATPCNDCGGNLTDEDCAMYCENISPTETATEIALDDAVLDDDVVLDTSSGPRHTRSWEDTSRNLLHAVELLDGVTLKDALARFNPDDDPDVARLLTRLLTPGLHVCGRHQ